MNDSNCDFIGRKINWKRFSFIRREVNCNFIFEFWSSHLVHELEKHLRVTKARVTLNSKVWSFSYIWGGGWKSYLMSRRTYFISDEFFLEFIVVVQKVSFFCDKNIDIVHKSRLFDLYHSCNHFYETFVENPYQPHVTRFLFCVSKKDPTIF